MDYNRKTVNRGLRQHPEEEEQEALMNWARLYHKVYPPLKMLFHIPNGGKRNATEAARLKAQGVKAGVPDLFIAHPSGEYHGLFIEMKAGTNKPTDKQLQWIDDLRREGYAACVCYGWQSAATVIVGYLKEGKLDVDQENHRTMQEK